VCVTEASNPLPLLSPGPTARVLNRERMIQLQKLKHLFPLPPVAFDLSSKRVSMEERHVREYLKRHIHPFHHKYLVADLPGLLRSFATYLEKTPGFDGQ
jgi:hypothetical protein